MNDDDLYKAVQCSLASLQAPSPKILKEIQENMALLRRYAEEMSATWIAEHEARVALDKI